MNKLVGNAVVGQSGGPTAAINATLGGVIRGAFSGAGKDCIRTLYGMKNGVEGLLAENLVDLSALFAGDEKKLLELAHTPAAALGSCRKKLPVPGADNAVYEKLLAIFRKYDIRYFFYIGGNDSMDTVAKLSAYTKNQNYEMRIMGVPKTIDNDLLATDHTPGFGSAAKYIATSMAEIIRDCAVYTVPAVTIVEIMGRDAGWLTASAGIGLALGLPTPDFIYLPERAFDKAQFFADVRAALSRHPNVVIAVSEGVRFADGTYVCEGFGSAHVDVFGHKQLSGTGKALEYAVKDEIGCKVRSVELNILQRCASHIASATDIEESLGIGAAAVDAAVSGVSRQMMIFVRESTDPYRIRIESSDVSKIANGIRTVPENFINPQGNHITKECAAYLLPLIRGESAPAYRDGMPVFFTIS